MVPISPPADPSAMLEIKVKQESARIKNPCVGFARTSISDLLAKCAEGEGTEFQYLVSISI